MQVRRHDNYIKFQNKVATAMKEQEKMIGFIKRYYIFVFLFFIIFLVSISRVRYYLYGDTAIYYMGYLELKDGYFADNFLALFRGGGEHISLQTEGGWTYLLYFSSLLHDELPYYLAALLFPVTLFSLLFLLVLSNRKSKFAFLGAISILVMLSFSVTFSRNLWLLTNPLRDISSFFLTFLALIFATFVLFGLDKPRPKRCFVYLFLCGFTLGLSAWFRLPNLVIVLPISLIFLFVFLKVSSFKYNLQAAGLFVIAIFIGLLPLLGQNIFEGKKVYEAGQADLMILNPASLPQYKHLNPTKKEIFELSKNNVVSGLHLQNFKYTFPRIIKIMWRGIYGKKLLFVYLLLICIGLWKNPKHSLLFVLSSATTLFFYSFYDKYVERYLILHVILFMSSVVMGIVALLDLVAIKIKFLSNRYLLSFCNIALSIVFVYLVLDCRGSFENVCRERQQMFKYKEIMSGFVDREDIVYNTAFPLWTKESLTDLTKTWGWTGRDLELNRAQYSEKLLNQLDSMLAEGRRAYVFQPTKDLKYCPNWKMNDINLSYDSVFVTNVYSSARFDLSLFEIKQRQTKMFEDVIEVDGEKALIWCEDSNRGQVFPCMAKLEAGTIKTNLTLNAGFNVFPKIFDTTDSLVNLRLVSTEKPLPGIIMIKSFNGEMFFDLRDYVLAAVSGKTFENSYIVWSGDHLWRRDNMFVKSNDDHPRKLFTSVYIDQKCNVPISFHSLDSKSEVKLYVSIVDSDGSADEETINNKFEFFIDGERVEAMTKVANRQKNKIYYDLSFQFSGLENEQFTIVPIKEQVLSVHKIGVRIF